MSKGYLVNPEEGIVTLVEYKGYQEINQYIGCEVFTAVQDEDVSILADDEALLMLDEEKPVLITKVGGMTLLGKLLLTSLPDEFGETDAPTNEQVMGFIDRAKFMVRYPDGKIIEKRTILLKIPMD